MIAGNICHMGNFLSASQKVLCYIKIGFPAIDQIAGYYDFIWFCVFQHFQQCFVFWPKLSVVQIRHLRDNYFLVPGQNIQVDIGCLQRAVSPPNPDKQSAQQDTDSYDQKDAHFPFL